MLASFTQEGTFLPLDALIVGGFDTVTRQITLVAGQNLLRGSVLGKATATGKFALALSASSDGSQSPSVILAEDCNASAGDTVAIAYFKAVVDENACIFGAGVTPASARDPLRAMGIHLQSSITR